MARRSPLTAIFDPPIRYGSKTPTAQIGPPIVTVTVNQDGGQADPTSDLPILFTVVFSEPVTGFTSGDVVLSGTANPTACSVSGSGASYTISVTAVSDVGTVIVDIPGGVAASIATGVLNSAATSTDHTVTYVVYPATFVFANGWHGVNTSLLASHQVDLPSNPGWLPGDYAIVAARNTNGGTITPPSWLSRIDGQAAGTNPALFGGFITDGLEFNTHFFGNGRQVSGDMANGIALTYSEGTPAAREQAVVVFRNPSAAGATGVVHEVLDDSPVLNNNVGPINVVTDGEGVLIGLASASGSSTFVMTATSLLNIENNGRLQRAFGVSGPAAGYSFTHDGVSVASLGSSNDFWAMALAPGPLGYNPSSSISYVGAGADALGVGGTGTLNVPLPSGIQANDLLMIVTHANDNAGDGFQPESGWFLCGRYFQHARDTKVFMKRAIGGGSDPTPQLDSSTGGGMSYRQAKCFAYRNVAGVMPVNGTSALTLTPGWNTHVANIVAIATFAFDFWVPAGASNLAGYTQRAQIADTSHGGLVMAEKLIASPGAPGFPTWTQSGGTAASCFLTYLIPA